MRRGAKPGKAKVVAKRPRPRTSPKDEASKRHDLEKRLAESLEQQAATAEILRVIASSPSDVQPVFDTIVRNAGRVCDAVDAVLSLRKENDLTVSAHWGPLGVQLGRRAPLTEGSVNGRTILAARPIHVEDLSTASGFPEGRELALRWGHRTTLGVPLLREGEALGALVMRRTEARPFSDTQIAMLQTFADQAVIAIENVRLFNETKAALEQQTTTSEILRVISSSPTDTQPVLDGVAEGAARLCEAFDAAIFRLDGNRLRLVAHHGPIPYGPPGDFTRPLVRGTAGGRSVLEGRTVQIADLFAESSEFPEGSALAQEFGVRTILSVPMMRGGVAIGTISLRRTEVQLFTEQQVALLETFADQAVIAIENVRLFNETREALEREKATSEILRVIGSSPTDAQPVFETIARSGVSVCAALGCAVFVVDSDMLRVAATHGIRPQRLERFRQEYPVPLDAEIDTAQTIRARRMFHLADIEHNPKASASDIENARLAGYRTRLMVPMVRGDRALGLIAVTREAPTPFSDQQVELLQTFADQAVIAIQNVRLFKELEARNRDLTEGLERETATGEILRVISASPTDTQPVLEAILDSGKRLCNATFGAVFRFEGDAFILAASTMISSEFATWLRGHPLRPGPGTPLTRAGIDRRPVQVADILADPDFAPPDIYRREGMRTALAVPMLKDDVLLGALTFHRHTVQPFTDQQVALLETFAAQAVIAIENVRLFTELEGRNRDLTATSEILRVISSSPTDVQPVFDTIVRSAVMLCNGLFGSVCQFDGELLHFVAQQNHTPEALEEVRRVYPARPTRALWATRAILERAVVHIPDVEVDPEYQHHAIPRAIGFRSGLFVPMLREGAPIGVIMVSRAEAGPFSDRQIELLKTFADQAVIAIENVRLFTELQTSNRDLTTALDQQTATSDILRVISRSQTDVQPVFDAILGSAVRLLRGYSGTLTRLVGDQIELVALTSTDDSGDAALRAAYPQPLQSEGTAAQAMRDRATLNIADAHTDPRVSEAQRAYARVRGYRSWAVVPLLRPDEAVGTISVTRRDPGGFTDDEIALLKTFADQAVIAIENVRLFNELEGRNRDLTATSEILRVISSSPTDVQPVFDTIVRSAVRLCDGLFSGLLKFDGELLHYVAHHNFTPEALEEVRRVFPARASRGYGAGRAIVERAVVHIPDVELDPEFQLPALYRTVGWRSGLFVPMLREGAPIGVIAVTRAEPGPFSGNEIELLKTFADQAVIAVENVRLFKELEARTGELTQSVEKLTALGEVSRAVSSTLDVETVLQTIVSRATQLAGADGCAVYEFDDATEAFHIRATHNLDPVLVETLRLAPLRKGEGAMGRAAETREPTQVADIAAPGAYQSHIRDTLLGAGYRALLSVPLLREGEIIGSLSLNRHTPGEFPPEAVEVLKTFATQSALAIQNARLFREIADKSAQLEAASRHKSEFLANMSHELRTPLNAIIGFSEVLTERMFGELNEKQDEYLKDIYASGQHLLSLINDILDLSKIEAGRMELEAADFDLPSAIDNALILVRERATRRGITLGRAIDERLGHIRGDERKVKQVLLNLLSNALKFTPEGGRIDVSARLQDGAAEIAVADTGVGIAPEDQEAVFEEFRQVGTADKKVEGTGLGLALSRKFIELHGGRIWVKSQVGHGSTFTFTLPVRRED